VPGDALEAAGGVVPQRERERPGVRVFVAGWFRGEEERGQDVRLLRLDGGQAQLLRESDVTPPGRSPPRVAQDRGGVRLETSDDADVLFFFFFFGARQFVAPSSGVRYPRLPVGLVVVLGRHVLPDRLRSGHPLLLPGPLDGMPGRLALGALRRPRTVPAALLGFYGDDINAIITFGEEEGGDGAAATAGPAADAEPEDVVPEPEEGDDDAAEADLRELRRQP